MAELVMVLLRYPPSVGEQAIDNARRASPQFVPTIPQVEEACEVLIADTRRAITYAQEWDRRSREQLEERSRIEAGDEREPLEHRKQVAARILQEFHWKKLSEVAE